jgi:hypothetical protein
MDKVLEPLEQAAEFLKRHPNLDGSRLLKKEATALVKALDKYNDKAQELELSLTPDYAETAALIASEGKSLVTPDFVREFTRKQCSTILDFNKINKKERDALLLLTAQNGKLQALRKQLDPTKKYRERFQRLLSESDEVIKLTIFAMKARDFQEIVKAAGLDAPRTKSGTVSTGKGAKEIVLKQILREKKSDELMERLSNE